MMKLQNWGVGVLLAVAANSVQAQAYFSSTTQIGGAPLANFEGFAEGTLILNQYAGVTFGQAPLAGRPQIDNPPYLFGYSGVGGSSALTGSLEGGYPFVTVAGITATFTAPMARVEAWFSDNAPLGSYTFSAFGAGDLLLESLGITSTQPLGFYVGFNRAAADIVRVQFGPSTAFGDAFAIDDLRASPTVVPEPSTLVLMGLGGALLAAWRHRRLA